MKEFTEKHADKITGVISCFGRILFKGYLPFGWSEPMEQFKPAKTCAAGISGGCLHGRRAGL